MTDSTRPVLLLEVPFDSGLTGVRMGAGPAALAPEAARRLRMRGHNAVRHSVEPSSVWRAELRSAFELHRAVAALVREAGPAVLPVLLAGNCNTSLGMLAGTSRRGERQGLVWFDAHADFNTPDTDATGFLDGQGLAMLVGRCWRAATSSVPGFTAIAERRVLLIGARALDPAEEAALRTSDVAVLPPDAACDPEPVRRALEDLAEESDVVHVHIDLDVHDPRVGVANGWAEPDGLTASQVRELVQRIAARVPVRSASLASYDPEFDHDGRMREAALQLIAELAALGGRRDA